MSHPLMRIYARNLDYQLFKRDWTAQQLANELGLDLRTVLRLRSAQINRIDPEIFSAICDVFRCTPNDLLMPRDDLHYAIN